MNFSFLPTKIKEQVKTLVADKVPISLARSSTTLDGAAGESYVLGYEDKLIVFSRKLGQNDYTSISGDFGKDIGLVKVRKEGVNTFLDTEIGGKQYSLKFSSFEEKSLNPIAAKWQNASSGGGTGVTAESVPSEKTAPASDSSSDGKLSLTAGLAVGLMFVAAVDDEVAPEEDQYITYTFNNDQALLRSALSYYKSHSFDEFLIAVSYMNQEQKLCYVANMMELGMSDGVLHRSEMKFIRQFCDYMEVTDEEYDTIKQILLIKNKLSILG